MTLALWDTPIAAAAASGLTGARDVSVQRMRPEACAAAVLKGQADVALVPTTMVLQGAEGFEIVPDVAVASWKYPFARIVLKRGLDTTDPTLACDRRTVQEQFVAEVILREHYQLAPEKVLYANAPSPKELLQGEEDAALVTASDPGALPDLGRLGGGGLVMDLGQEWFELAKYPMVWGFFVAREGTLDPETTARLRDALIASEERRAGWVKEAAHPLAESFFAEELRLRYDDMALASLTELKHHLFYSDVIAHIPDLAFAALPEDEEEERE